MMSSTMMRNALMSPVHNASTSGVAANPLKIFATKAARNAFCDNVKKIRAEQCCDENCRRAKSCCHIGCPRDSVNSIPRGKLLYSYVAYNYLAFVGVVTAPLTVGVSQIMQATLSTTDSSISATLTTYTGVLPVPPSGVIQLLFPYGTGIIPTVPSQIIFMLTGVKDSNYPAVAGAHRLNTRWLVETTTTSGQWTMTALSVSDMSIKDYVQVRLYSSAATPTVAPAPQVMRVTNVNCIEQTIELTETELATVIRAQRVSADCLTPPSNACHLCYRNPGTCGGNRCGKHVCRFAVNSAQTELVMRGSLFDERSKMVGTTPETVMQSVEKYGSRKHKMTRDLLGMHVGLDVDRKSGHIVRGRNEAPLSLGRDRNEALQTKELMMHKNDEHKALVEYALLMRQYLGAGMAPGRSGRFANAAAASSSPFANAASAMAPRPNVATRPARTNNVSKRSLGPSAANISSGTPQRQGGLFDGGLFTEN